MLDDASAEKEVKADDLARVADYLRMTKRRL
jgi:hypothetical protein